MYGCCARRNLLRSPGAAHLAAQRVALQFDLMAPVKNLGYLLASSASKTPITTMPPALRETPSRYAPNADAGDALMRLVPSDALQLQVADPGVEPGRHPACVGKTASTPSFWISHSSILRLLGMPADLPSRSCGRPGTARIRVAHALHAVARRRHRAFVDVELGHRHLAFELFGELFQRGLAQLPGAAPPPQKSTRDRRSGLQNVLQFETFVR